LVLTVHISSGIFALAYTCKFIGMVEHVVEDVAVNEKVMFAIAELQPETPARIERHWIEAS
jgi:hypothetical protein